MWSSIFGTLLEQHFGHIRAGAALETLLDKAPPSYDAIKNNHEDLITKILLPKLEYYFGPLSSEQKKQIMGLAKVAFKIADVFTDTKLEPIITGYFNHIYNAPDVEEAIRALLRSKGYDPDQFRQEIVNIMKEHGLEKHIHPDFLERREESITTAGAPATKIITKKEPSVEDLTIETLKGMGMDLKLETGNIAERKANIYSWLRENGLIQVDERDGRKIVRPTEKLHALLGKHGGNVAAAMIKWAAEEGVGLEHVEPVAKILAALEEFRQMAKKQDPALAKKLEKAMKSKHTVKELLHTVIGLLPLDKLSKKWQKSFGVPLMELLKREPRLVKAFLDSMEDTKELASVSVPVEWLHFLQREALNSATLYRMTFSAYESLAIRGLSREGQKITQKMKEVLERAIHVVPEAEVFEGLRREVETLARLVAIMKDLSYLEILETELVPLLEKVPETRKVGLFKRESPRRKVEDFAALLMEGNLDEDEAERKAGELREYLKSYLASEEVEKLVAGLMLPFRARKLLEKHGTAEGFLFEYAHSKASRCLLIEAHLAEAGDNKQLHDTLLRTMANVPSVLGTKRMTLKGFEHNMSILRKLAR